MKIKYLLISLFITAIQTGCSNSSLHNESQNISDKDSDTHFASVTDTVTDTINETTDEPYTDDIYDTDTYSDTNSDTFSDTNSDTFSDTNSDTYSDTNSDTFSDTNSDTGWPALTMDQIGEPQLIADNFSFTEGPVWDEVNQRLLFSDIDADTIYSLTLPDTVTVFITPSGNANGLALGKDNQLLVAEQGNRQISIIKNNQSAKTVVDSFNGISLNSPNDLTIRSDGIIYFSDPEFGLAGTPSALGFMGLFSISTDDKLTLEGSFEGSPNGVALSPDEKTLYVAITFSNQILGFDINQNGHLENEKLFASITEPDGMTIDVAGNMYIAGLSDNNESAVLVLSPDGTLIGIIPLDYAPTNCTLGGPNGNILFITAREALYMVKVPVPGF